jgi:glycosyltransferase involved in cell wall biosynthesis
VIESDAEAIVRSARAMDADVIWFGYGNISFDVISRVKEKAPDIPVVCDTDSVWSRFVLRELPLETDPARREQIEKEGKQKEAEERAWVDLCEVTTAVSEVDAQYYRSIAEDPDRIALFPNVVDLDNYRGEVAKPDELRSPSIFLAGSFGAPSSPMNRAATWFIQEVLPLVTAQAPEALLYLIGRRSEEVTAAQRHPHVRVLGQVPSVVPYLRHSDVSVVPLSYESGTRFKILEAGAASIPIVSTTLGAEGLPVADGKSALLADSPEGFAGAVVRVLTDRSLAQRLATGLERLVEANFSVDALSTRAREIVDTALEVRTRSGRGI